MPFNWYFPGIRTAITNANMKTKLNHTAIYVVKLEPSAAFYKDIIGLETTPEPFQDGKHAWFLTGTNTMLHIIEGAESRMLYYKNQHTCFSVASVEDFTRLLQLRQLAWEDVHGTKNAITTRIDGVKQIWLQDPDGYWIEINDDKS